MIWRRASSAKTSSWAAVEGAYFEAILLFAFTCERVIYIMISDLQIMDKGGILVYLMGKLVMRIERTGLVPVHLKFVVLPVLYCYF